MGKLTSMGIGAAICVGLALSAGVAQAASDGPFLTEALQVNEVELELGRLAADHAGSADVKATGAKMVEKHTALGKQLRDLARQAGVNEAPALSPDQQTTVTRLSWLSGRDFDQAFTMTVDAGHASELAMYRAEVGHAEDPGLDALARQRVTILERALAQAAHAAAGTRDSDW